MTEIRTEAVPLVDGSVLRLTVAEPVSSIRGGIVVLHEARGVTDSVRGLVSGLAGDGWLAVAPHLYHRDGADELDGDDDDHVREHVERLDGQQVMSDTDTAFGWLADHGVTADRMGVLGFDLGATAALVVASQRSLGAAVTVAAAGVSTPLAEGLPALVDVVGELTCPWLGLYGETGDPVDPQDVDRLREAAHASNRVVDVVVYPDREHRFDADVESAGIDPSGGEPGGDSEGDVVEARSRVLNWFDAHLR